MHRVEWTASALEDIESLFDHVAEQASPLEAEHLVAACCAALTR